MNIVECDQQLNSSNTHFRLKNISAHCYTAQEKLQSCQIMNDVCGANLNPKSTNNRYDFKKVSVYMCSVLTSINPLIVKV